MLDGYVVFPFFFFTVTVTIGITVVDGRSFFWRASFTQHTVFVRP